MSAVRTRLDAGATEDELNRWLVRVAAANGYCGFHIKTSVAHVQGVHSAREHGHADAIGFPDWVFAREGAPLLFLEAKGIGGLTDRDQQRWLDVLRRTEGPTVARLAWPKHAPEVLDFFRRAA